MLLTLVHMILLHNTDQPSVGPRWVEQVCGQQCGHCSQLMERCPPDTILWPVSHCCSYFDFDVIPLDKMKINFPVMWRCDSSWNFWKESINSEDSLQFLQHCSHWWQCMIKYIWYKISTIDITCSSDFMNRDSLCPCVACNQNKHCKCSINSLLWKKNIFSIHHILVLMGTFASICYDYTEFQWVIPGYKCITSYRGTA